MMKRGMEDDEGEKHQLVEHATVNLLDKLSLVTQKPASIGFQLKNKNLDNHIPKIYFFQAFYWCAQLLKRDLLINL